MKTSPLMLTFNMDELLTLSSALSLAAAIYRDDEQGADTKAKGDLAAWHASDMEALEVRVEEARAARRRA